MIVLPIILIRVHQSQAGRSHVLLANVALCVLVDESIAFKFKPLRLQLFQLHKGDICSVFTQVDLGMLVPEDV